MKRLVRTLVALLLVGLAGCSGDAAGKESSSAAQSGSATDRSGSGSSGNSIAPPDGSAKNDAGADDPIEKPVSEDEMFPCSLLRDADLTGILGGDLGPGDARVAGLTSNDMTFKGKSCIWGKDSPLEVKLGVYADDGTPADPLSCPEPTSSIDEVTPMSGLGAQAWWIWDDLSGEEGELRVCLPDSLVRVQIISDDGRESTSSQPQAMQLFAIIKAGL